MKQKLLQAVSDISVKAGIFRELQKVHTARKPLFTEREILLLEIAGEFGPVTETELCKVFGLSQSQMSEQVKRLVERGALKKSRKGNADGRTRPLTITSDGKSALKASKTATARRLEFLLGHLTEEQQESLMPIVESIGCTIDDRLRKDVFGRF